MDGSQQAQGNIIAKKKLLIVEDDFFIRDIYTIEAQDKGFEVRVSGDGEDALRQVESFMPDVILLDIMLPKLDGGGVTKRLKANERFRNIPIIIITNLEDQPKERELRELGVADYMYKVKNTPASVIEKVRQFC